MRAALCVGVAAVAMLLAGCADDATTSVSVAASPTTSSPSIAAPADAWVAVVASEQDPGLLGGDRKRVLAALGDALEGSIVVSPGACLEGLPERYTDGYVLAIQRSSLDDVRALAAQLPQPPSFVGVVTVTCSD